MDIYLHDCADAMQIVLRGDCAGERVRQLEWAWTTARSVLNGRALVVDVSEVRNADESAQSLLSRMRAAGARIILAQPAAAPRRRLWGFVPRVLRLRIR